MKVKCPRCGFKGELIDERCQVCDFIVEAKPSLLLKIQSMKPSKIIASLMAVVVILIIVISIIPSTPTPEIRALQESFKRKYSEPIDGFLGVSWGDSLELAHKKLLGNGYKIKEIDISMQKIALEPIELAGYKAEHGALNFYSKGFYDGIIFIRYQSESERISKMVKIFSVIEQKYGPPSYPVPALYKKLKSNPDSGLYIWESLDQCEISVQKVLKFSCIGLRYQDKKVEAEAEAELIPKQKEKERLLEAERRSKEEEQRKQLKDSSKRF